MNKYENLSNHRNKENITTDTKIALSILPNELIIIPLSWHDKNGLSINNDICI